MDGIYPLLRNGGNIHASFYHEPRRCSLSTHPPDLPQAVHVERHRKKEQLRCNRQERTY